MEYNQNLLESIEKQQQKDKFLWKKPLMINIRKKEAGFDDFFKQTHGKFKKVKSIEIIWLQNEYIKGIQFHYLTDDNQTVVGHKMQIFQKSDLKTILFKLEDDEYITKIYGRKGLVLDSLGFKTNKGHTCYLGGNGGEKFSVEAPVGFHFCTFAGSCGDCQQSLSSLLSDVALQILQIPTKTHQIKQSSVILKQKILPIIRNLIDYLTIEEFLNLFLLNKTFANFRLDNFILKQIIYRIIYGLDTNQRKYAKIILKKLDPEIEWVKELTNLYKYKDFITGQAILVAGGFVSQRSCNNNCFFEIYLEGKAKMNVQLFNKEKERIVSIEIKNKQIPITFTLMQMQYLHENKENQEISQIIFKVRGKDQINWPEHYGAYFTQIFIRLLPYNEETTKLKK